MNYLFLRRIHFLRANRSPPRCLCTRGKRHRDPRFLLVANRLRSYSFTRLVAIESVFAVRAAFISLPPTEKRTGKPSSLTVDRRIVDGSALIREEMGQRSQLGKLSLLHGNAFDRCHQPRSKRTNISLHHSADQFAVSLLAFADIGNATMLKKHFQHGTVSPGKIDVL